jgi:hypothetical protein
MQSEKLFEAIRGVGGKVRLVMLPFESHGYVARESTEHTIAEMVAWFDRHVKNAPPRAPRPVTTRPSPVRKNEVERGVEGPRGRAERGGPNVPR